MTVNYLHTYWRRLRLFRHSGSVLVDYRILRNKIKTWRAAA